MSFDVFVTFDGDCREALNFYAQVFKQKVPAQIMATDKFGIIWQISKAP